MKIHPLIALGIALLSPLGLASPDFSCAVPSAMLSPRVTERVQGLYEAISPDTETTPEGVQIIVHQLDSFIRCEINLVHDGSVVNRKGDVSAFFDRGTFHMVSAYLKETDESSPTRLPSWVQPAGVPPLVPGKGVPLVTFAALKQLRRHGVVAGGLQRMHLGDVFEIRSIAELELARRKWKDQHPGETLTRAIDSELVRGVHTLQYAETIATQSGHRIKSVRLVGGSEMEFGAIKEDRDAGWTERAKSLGIRATDRVLAGYSIDVVLESL